MRASIATVSLPELTRFNIAVWDILRAILRLMTIPTNDSEMKYEVIITFRKEPGGGGNFEGDVAFKDINSSQLVKLDPPFNAPVTFMPPEGCSLKESFDWLASEVAKLAYVMSHGKIWPSASIVEGAWKVQDGWFVLQYQTTDPGLTEM